MTTVMAWDLATLCGVAFGAAGDRPRATTIHLGNGLKGKKGFTEEQKWDTFQKGARDLLRVHRPDILVFEAPIGGGGRVDYFLIGLSVLLRLEASRAGLSAEPVMISSVRKHFLGKALGTRDFPDLDVNRKGDKDRARERIKQLVIRRCQHLGWTPRDDNEADAMAVFDWAQCEKAGVQPAPLGGLFEESVG